MKLKMSIGFNLVMVGLLAVTFHVSDNKIILLEKAISAANAYAVGDVSKAVSIRDKIIRASNEYPEEFRSLFSVISKDYALHLFRQAQEEFVKGNIDEAEKTFDSATGYANDSKLLNPLPVWVTRLDLGIKEIRARQLLANIQVSTGIVNESEGKIREAREYYKKALETSPNNTDAKIGLSALKDKP